MRKSLLMAILLIGTNAIALPASAPPMKTYVMSLADHGVRFSLPEEMTRGSWPIKVAAHFDPQHPSFLKNGFYSVFDTLHDLNGPFWVGAYGSLKVHFMVQKRDRRFAGDITTIEGLEEYVREWHKTIEGVRGDYTFSRVELNGMPAIRRERNTFGDPGKREPEHLEIFSIPLDEEMFLDVGFNVMAWQGGRGKERRWKPKAEALREAIKPSIVVDPAPTR
jgi:hypothetical protein